MANYQVSKEIDVRGEVCPIPDVEAKRAVQAANDGEIILVRIDYPLSKERIPETVKKLGSEVLEIEEAAPGEWNIYIKVKK